MHILRIIKNFSMNKKLNCYYDWNVKGKKILKSIFMFIVYR